MGTQIPSKSRQNAVWMMPVTDEEGSFEICFKLTLLPADLCGSSPALVGTCRLRLPETRVPGSLNRRQLFGGYRPGAESGGKLRHAGGGQHKAGMTGAFFEYFDIEGKQLRYWKVFSEVAQVSEVMDA
jgi:hypothetical protein